MKKEEDRSPFGERLTDCPLCGAKLQAGFLAARAYWMKTANPAGLGERFIRGLRNWKNAHACRCLKCGFIAFKVRDWAGPKDSSAVF